MKDKSYYYNQDAFKTMNDITLIHGDCLEEMKKIPDKSVDLALTDPPYQARFQQGGGHFGDRQYFKSINEGVGSSLNFEIKQFLPEIRRIIKTPFNAYFWTSQRLIYDYIKFAKDNNYHYDILVWAKKNPIPTKNNKYLPDLEYCVYIREKGAYFSNDEQFDFYRKFIITGINKSEWGHPTEKPLRTIKPAICISSKKDDIILDPFMGSGTTGVACKELGRKFIGIEINKGYYEIAKKRIFNTQRSMF